MQIAPEANIIHIPRKNDKENGPLSAEKMPNPAKLPCAWLAGASVARHPSCVFSPRSCFVHVASTFENMVCIYMYIYIWDLTSESVDFHHHSMEIPSKMLADKLDEFKHGGFKNKFFKGYRGIF